MIAGGAALTCFPFFFFPGRRYLPQIELTFVVMGRSPDRAMAAFVYSAPCGAMDFQKLKFTPRGVKAWKVYRIPTA